MVVMALGPDPFLPTPSSVVGRRVSCWTATTRDLRAVPAPISKMSASSAPVRNHGNSYLCFLAYAISKTGRESSLPMYMADWVLKLAATLKTKAYL